MPACPSTLSHGTCSTLTGNDRAQTWIREFFGECMLGLHGCQRKTRVLEPGRPPGFVRAIRGHHTHLCAGLRLCGAPGPSGQSPSRLRYRAVSASEHLRSRNGSP